MKKKFDTILIANRGEVAVRIIKTSKKLGYRTIAVYSSEDANSLHVDMADESYCIGSAAPNKSYLNISNIIKAAKNSGAQAIHPGYGFLSENYLLAEACKKEKICFIGPDIESIKIMGNKAASKRELIKLGIDCIPGYQGKIQSLRRLKKEAEIIGFPIMIKAADGGGGKGMRLVEKGKDFEENIILAQSEAKNSFGSKELILEKAILSPRHIEVQIFSDNFGNCIHLGERDCSIQRRHQKIIEESPSPVVDEVLRHRMGEVAIRIAKSINYSGAGTVEFLLDRNNNFYFLEMNTRLQVEHAITEMITNIDIVELQILVAQGNKLNLAQEDISFSGHSIEARLYAEDPEKDFLPMTGTLEFWKQSELDNIRIDAGVKTGQKISSYYDPMIGKIISWGKDRENARVNLKKAIDRTVVFGVPTNKLFLSEIMSNKTFSIGEVTTSFLSQESKNLNFKLSDIDIKYFQIAIVIQYLVRRDESFSNAIRVSEDLKNWSSNYFIKSRFDFELNNQNFYGFVSCDSNSIYQSTIDDNIASIAVEEIGSRELICVIDKKEYMVDYLFKSNIRKLFLNIDGKYFTLIDKNTKTSSKSGIDSDGIIFSPMHGKLLKILVKKGAKVKKGTPLVIIEAMKMQHKIESDSIGVINKIYIKPGSQLDANDKILEIKNNNLNKIIK